MVLRESGDDVLCVGQASHAWISGQLARQWGNEAFARPDPFEEVCLGAEQHDVGMAEWDLRPQLNPETGRPRSFMELPLATHLGLWTAAPTKVLTASPYAALLVSMHASALYRRRTETPETRAFLAEQQGLQQELIAAMHEPPDRARFNQRLIWTLDFLSLGLLLDWAPETVTAPTRPGEPDAEIALQPTTVEPWPFATQEIEVRAHARRLKGRCADQRSLDAALAAAPWETLTFALRRAG